MNEPIEMALARLRRYDEREPLVQALLREAHSNAESDYNDSTYRKSLRAAVEALRAFKLSASVAEGDESA